MNQQAQETPYKKFTPTAEQMPNFMRAVEHLYRAIAKQPKEDFIKETKSA